MDNTKGALPFNITLVVMMVFILIYAWVQLSYKYNSFERSLGEKQYELLHIYQRAESFLLYIDQSAKYSLEQSVYDLAKSGGISELDTSDTEIIDPGTDDTSEVMPKNDCGKIKGSNVWYAIKKDESKNKIVVQCFDENSVSYNMEYLFDKSLNAYLQQHPDNIPINNYFYEETGNLEVIGIPERPLKFEIYNVRLSVGMGGSETTAIQPVQVATGQPSCLRKARSINSATGAASANIPQTPPVSIPKETIQISKQCIPSNLQGAISIGQDLIDFTDTNLCSKGETCILRTEAFQMLQIAESIAEQKGKKFLVYSSYRTPERQKDLWEGKTPERYKQRYPNEKIRQEHVCNPILGVEGCPHLSGNAIDLRFNKKEWAMSMAEWKEVAKIMEAAGWAPYVKDNRVIERWHFECCGTKRYLAYVEKKEGVLSG